MALGEFKKKGKKCVGTVLVIPEIMCTFVCSPKRQHCPVTWRLLKDGYLIALDKRFCSVPDTVMGRHMFFSLFRIEIDVVQAGK